ncbi:MAG: error-prone DNA polymerase, partial [Pseudomonadota bacterium]|nr:error-prone DNA polymerase [Pseudomonadota bacterium]
ELAHRTWQGAAWRYPDGLPAKVKVLIDHELSLIAKLDYAPYFLTVDDIVRFAREQGILCQGRGSAANSAVCYCLGITAVDPERADPLFERFVSEARDEPPDIDVDFEHERREEVIQYIYRKYGRARAGLAATVITYRARSAVREVGKAMGLTGDVVGHLAGQVWGRSDSALDDARIRELGLDPDDRRLRLTLNLTRQLIGFPRHLSQHVGGFVMTRGRLDELVPIENAAMAERTVVEWDKDDLDALGILKVDVLALGMLSCVRKAFDLLAQHYQRPLDLATVPAEDGAVYDMLCKGDSLGVFQVESRAQMAMLPRLKPRAFYDLVIQVAIVRPGPIQGDMVHPYLRRRAGLENVDYPSADLRGVLEKTLGVPLFQEQAMKIAIVAAGFTPAEADQLRRAMATFKKTGTIGHFRDKMISGMIGNGYDPDFAERCFQQIEGFGNYGFPESHAASFALLVYISSWLKCHYPAVFACALLNAQPMGFYAPAQIVRDARDHGVTVLPPCVNASQWDCTLEPAADGLALRLGLRQIKGVKQDDAEILVACRGGGYRDPRDLWRRSGLSWNALEALARGDAYRGLGLDRRRAFWAVRGLAQAITGPAEARPGALPLFAPAEARDGRAVAQCEAAVALPATPLGEDVVDDYAALRLSLKAHPVSLLRADLAASGRVTAADLG